MLLLLFFFIYINNLYRFYFNAAQAKCYVVAVTCFPVLHYSTVFIIIIIIIIIIHSIYTALSGILEFGYRLMLGEYYSL